MQTSTDIIRNYLKQNCSEWKCIQSNNSYGYSLDNKYVDIAMVNNDEDIVISYTDISITGTDRAKPQIRVFMDKQRNVYEFARQNKKRFFLFTIFSKDLAMAKNINNFDPRDFIVSIETNVDHETSRRDLRSLYDYLDDYIGKNGDVDYLRCTQGQHQSGIYQASFIRIKKDGIDTPETLKEYIRFFDNRPYMDSKDNTTVQSEGKDIDFPYNRIVFGAPGTGKSHTLDQDSKVFGMNQERVTFHPNYSYAHFVGTYKPVEGDKTGEISYEYVPGPFMRMYVEAKMHPEQNYLLLIEEINRANVAAVFGDVFQLLDREDGISEYSITTSEDMKHYLLKKLTEKKTLEECNKEELELCNYMKIPNNLYLWATMNSADQGVFPMDTAFKRRWEFEYLGIDKERKKVESYVIPMGMSKNRYYVKWNDLREKINGILSKDENRVNEDKLLGPFFISRCVLSNALGDEKTEDRFIKAFESKVIMYLFEDVMKMRSEKIFVEYKGQKLFSKICEAFEMQGEKIFGIDDLQHVEKGRQE